MNLSKETNICVKENDIRVAYYNSLLKRKNLILIM